jgi:hypothetical protein
MYSSITYDVGRVAEWFKAPVLKTGRGFTPPREFESHPFRQALKDTPARIIPMQLGAAKAAYPTPLTTVGVIWINPSRAKHQQGARGIQITAPIVGWWCPGNDYEATSVVDRFCDRFPFVCATSCSRLIRSRLIRSRRNARFRSSWHWWRNARSRSGWYWRSRGIKRLRHLCIRDRNTGTKHVSPHQRLRQCEGESC